MSISETVPVTVKNCPTPFESYAWLRYDQCAERNTLGKLHKSSAERSIPFVYVKTLAFRMDQVKISVVFLFSLFKPQNEIAWFGWETIGLGVRFVATEN